jgi:DNA-binding NarL/FixJ family response regulator
MRTPAHRVCRTTQGIEDFAHAVPWIAAMPAKRCRPNRMFEETSLLPCEERLSARELQVLQLVASAASNKHIARELDLSVHTVKRHVARMMARLRVASRAEAAAVYRAMRPLPRRADATPVDDFTARERDVFARVALGQSNQEIAMQLAVSVNTVKRHTANILDKLGVRSRIEAAAHHHEEPSTSPHSPHEMLPI